MNKEELIKFLKENLEVELDLITEGWEDNKYLQVTLKLEDKVISETSVFI